MRTTEHTDVLVVGAGPTGLALACQLRRLGVAVRIVDQNPAPSSTSKAIGLQYRVSEVLALMGVVDRFLAKGETSAAVNISAGGRQVLTLRLDGMEHKAGREAFVPRAIILPQPETEAILGDFLRELGGQVERRKAFVSFSQDPDRVVSRVAAADGAQEIIASRYLVSCEGAHSQIRKQAGIDFVGKAYPHDFVMADVELDWGVSRDEAHAWFHPDGMLAVFGLPGGRAWRLFIDVGAAGAPTEITLDLLQQLLAQRTGDHAVRVSNPTWVSRFKIHARMVDRFRRGRVFLAGDAAHLHSPSGGQGIATGIQDACNLAWKLAMVLQVGSPAALLDTYEEERLPIARSVLHTTDRNTAVQFSGSILGRLLRDRVALPLLSTQRVQRWLVTRLSQLDQNYRGSSLASHHDAAGPFARVRVRAGDRAPDVVFRRGRSGERTSLFDHLQRSRFVAVIGGHGSPATARTTARLGGLGIDCLRVVPRPGQHDDRLADWYGDLDRVYGARGEFCYLVRPDGYVGLFTRPFDEHSVRAYLSKLWPADSVDAAWCGDSDRSPEPSVP